jgi:hypothetical protein
MIKQKKSISSKFFQLVNIVVEPLWQKAYQFMKMDAI